MSLTTVPMTLREARAYVTRVHRHHVAPQGGLFAIGLSEADEVVGVVIVGMPVARMLAGEKITESARTHAREMFAARRRLAAGK